MKIDEKWYDCKSGKYVCPHCGKLYTKKGICSHIWRTHGDGKNRKLGGCPKNHVSWNRGLTKETDDRIKRNSESVKATYNSPDYVPYWKGKKHSKYTIKKLKRNAGGVRKGAGRGKGGYYKGIWCDSTWELAWVIYSLDHNINFRRNVEGFPYIWKGESKLYYPDFILDDSIEYVEVKGYMTEKDKAKLKAFPNPIKVINKNLIVPYIEYVTKCYKTKDLVTLYDAGTCTSKRRPDKVCPQCNQIFTPNGNSQITCSIDCRRDRLRIIGRQRSVVNEYPTKDQLLTEIELLGFVGTGKKYGVTDNAVRKWCVKYKVDPHTIKRRLSDRKLYVKVCPVCTNEYTTIDKRQICCSRVCGNKLRYLNKKGK